MLEANFGRNFCPRAHKLEQPDAKHAEDHQDGHQVEKKNVNGDVKLECVGQINVIKGFVVDFKGVVRVDISIGTKFVLCIISHRNRH